MDKELIKAKAQEILEFPLDDTTFVHALTVDFPRAAKELEQDYTESFGPGWRHNKDIVDGDEMSLCISLYTVAPTIAAALEQIQRSGEAAKTAQTMLRNAYNLASYQANLRQYNADAEFILGTEPEAFEDFLEEAKYQGKTDHAPNLQEHFQSESEHHASAAANYRVLAQNIRELCEACGVKISHGRHR